LRVLPVLKTETTEVSTTMERKLVGDMPVPMSSSWGMRSVFSVMLMMPEVKSNNGESAWDDFIVGGGQGFAWQVVVDGASIETGFRNNIGIFNRLAPTLDAVEEIRIDTAAFKAEQTHTSGGNMVLTTKSGTNEFHGGAFDFYKSQVLDANTWANNRIGGKKAIYHKNEFGFSASGPIFVPKLYNGKNRTFFLFSYEGSRQPSTSGPGLLTVATAAMKQGDFSDWKKANGTSSRSTILHHAGQPCGRIHPAGVFGQPDPGLEDHPDRQEHHEVHGGSDRIDGIGAVSIRRHGVEPADDRHCAEQGDQQRGKHEVRSQYRDHEPSFVHLHAQRELQRQRLRS
jgi:hypothetical protein